MNQKDDYISRINRVIDYIETHLSHEFTLEGLADIACFSKYHFHRLFQGWMKETLFQFIQRIRLEKAADYLISSPERAITDIALSVGFGSSQAFARGFKKKFSLSPSEFRQKNSVLEDRKQYSPPQAPPFYLDLSPDGNRNWVFEEGNIVIRAEVKHWPLKRIAYLRYIGAYQGNEALFKKLWSEMMQWAVPRKIIDEATEFLTIYHDNYQLTDDDKLRLSLCMTIPEFINPNGKIGLGEIPEGDYVSRRFYLKAGEYEAAWNWFFQVWFPVSGYQPDDRPSFEYFPRNVAPVDERLCVDICIPVKPL